jgi:hypothetical protein
MGKGGGKDVTVGQNPHQPLVNEVQLDYIRFVVGDFAKLITQTLSITLMKL